MKYNIHAEIERDEELQYKFPFPDDVEICVSNVNPMDKIYPKFIVSAKNKLCQKGDNNDERQ
jgi:hypothetical protein|tara:strand:+ start:369 stop:554 length:186 start_codon:yes stop_codon:yes gene_type:complete